MSNARFSITPARAVKDSDLSDSIFRTLAALGIFGDENGWCWPGLKLLSEILNKSKPAVSKDIRLLKEKGYLSVHRRFNNKTGGQQSNHYQIKFDYPPLTPEVNPPLTPEVNHNDPVNDLDNDPMQNKKSSSKHVDMLDGILLYSQKGKERRESGKLDMEGWSVDVQEDAQEFSKIFNLPIPQSKTTRGDWTQGIRDIRREAQNIPLAAIFMEGKRLAEKEGWLDGIGRPPALVKSVGRIIRGIQAEQAGIPLAEDGSFYV
jgi:DNA-binding transcriptional ArsR family regulator